MIATDRTMAGKTANTCKFFVIVMLLSMLHAGLAMARTETLRWRHSDPTQVVAFQAEVGAQQGVFDRTFDLGVPQPDGSLVYTATIVVGDQEDVYVTLRARGSNGLLSSQSQVRFRPAPATAPPPTTPPTTPTPPSGSVIDFESAPLGAVVAGWYDTDANDSMQQNDALFSVQDLGGNRVLLTNAPLDDIHSHLLTTNPIPGSYAIRGRMRADSNDAGLGVTAYSQYPITHSYYRLDGTTGGTSRFALRTFSPWSCTSADTSVSVSSGTWYRFELSVTDLGDRNQIRGKVWIDGTPEPATHQQECIDSAANRIRSGAMGVWTQGTGNRYWDDLQQIDLGGSSSGGSLGTLDAPVLIGISPVY